MTFGIVSYKNVSDLILIQDSFLRIVMFSFHLLKVKPNAITVLVDCTSILLKFFWVNRYVSGGPYLLCLDFITCELIVYSSLKSFVLCSFVVFIIVNAPAFVNTFLVFLLFF